MTDQLREAIYYFEQEWELGGRGYLWDAGTAIRSRPLIMDAARKWLAVTESEVVRYCTEHDSLSAFQTGCDLARLGHSELDFRVADCAIVPMRLVGEDV